MNVREKDLLASWNHHCTSVNSSTYTVRESEQNRLGRIKVMQQDYSAFVSYYFPHYCHCPSAKFHIEAAEYIRNDKSCRAVFKWARSHAKSTHMNIFIPLWLMIQAEREINVMVIVGKSEDSAKTLLSDIQAELQYNQRFINDYGPQYNSGHWLDGEFVTSSGTAFFARGRGQSPRGLRYRDHRPDYIVIDDIDDDELCRSERRVNELARWVKEALFGSLDGGRGRFIIVGNLIGKNSVLQKICETEGVHVSQVNIYDENGAVTWRDKWTLQEVRELERFMGYRSFQKEYMNNPITEGSVFQLRHIQYGRMLPERDYKRIICYTDPSFKDSVRSDYKATVLCGLTKEGCYHVIKAYAAQCSISEMIRWHYDILDEYGDTPIQFYMESNFIQDLIIDEFRKAGASRGRQVPIRGDGRKKPDKFARIEALQPLFERGLIVINGEERNSPGIKVLEEQLLSFERGSRTHDDAPDALEGAIYLLNTRQRTQAGNYLYHISKSFRF